jgi:hypothetical protein
MAASFTRRNKRMEERNAKKVALRINQQTLNQINKQSPEEREKLLMLYKHMLEEKLNHKKDVQL